MARYKKKNAIQPPVARLIAVPAPSVVAPSPIPRPSAPAIRPKSHKPRPPQRPLKEALRELKRAVDMLKYSGAPVALSEFASPYLPFFCLTQQLKQEEDAADRLAARMEKKRDRLAKARRIRPYGGSSDEDGEDWGLEDYYTDEEEKRVEKARKTRCRALLQRLYSMFGKVCFFCPHLS